MTGPNTTNDEDAPTDPITLTVEIDPAAFDEPRQLMWERLIEEYGHETVADLVKANLQQDLTAQGMQLVNALWDNRDQIQVNPGGVETPQVPDQPGGNDD
ncbi:hypothetical protein [Natronomonas sp. LN261]|uniref:hypothetical protein n=1 Tax=Natronomonas sp. LN261 TaxID=2750669 RepID=UPI0015EEAFB0|nr:hypothetical protein [Natronomonas sp. LN261]